MRVHEIGNRVQDRWQEIAHSHGMTITTGGLPALANFTIEGLDPLAIKTFMTAQLLDRGYLAGVNLYASLAHTPDILNDYFTEIEPLFAQLAQMTNAELVAQLPNGPAQSGFTRLT